MTNTKRGPKPDINREDIELIDRMSRGHELELGKKSGIITEDSMSECGLDLPISPGSLIRDVRREVLKSELDDDQSRLCRRVSRQIVAAAEREVAARARGAVGARARRNHDGDLKERPRRHVVLDACEELGLEPPSDTHLLDKMLRRARSGHRVTAEQSAELIVGALDDLS